MYIYFANSIVLVLLHYYFTKNKNNILESYSWIFTIFFLSIFIGLRYEIGGDWTHYYNYYTWYGEGLEDVNYKNFLGLDAFYLLINKIAYFAGINFIGVNLICALIFMFALNIFLNNSKNKWLGLAISFPIIIVVLGMGYSRQGLAFAFSLLLLKSLEDKNFLNSIIYLVLAILSHKTSIIITAFVIINLLYHKKYIHLITITLIQIFFVIIFWDKFLHYLHFYAGTGQHMTSYGSLPRTLLISIIAFLFIISKRKNLYMNEYQIFMYTCISYMIIIIFPLSFITSVTADRLMLYLYSLKIAFVSSANLRDKAITRIVFLIISIYFLYLVTWICFGNNSFSWVPYNFVDFK